MRRTLVSIVAATFACASATALAQGSGGAGAARSGMSGSAAGRGSAQGKSTPGSDPGELAAGSTNNKGTGKSRRDARAGATRPK